MIHTLRSMLEWLGGHSAIVLVAMLVVVVCAWGFIELTDEVREGETQDFDEWAVRALRRADDPATPIGPNWLAEMGRDFTAMGGIAVLAFMTAAVVGYLLMQRKYHAMWLVIVAVVGGVVLSSLLKWLVARDRPELVPHLSHAYTASYPSGHSMLSTVAYMTLGTLLAGLVEQRIIKIYFLSLALLLSFLVGISRVYMGVHYPTDVLAGWTAGLAWATLCWLVARYLRRRGKIEAVDDRA